MSEEKKNEEELKELELDDMDQVAGGNLIEDLKDLIQKNILPDDTLKKAPLPFPQDRR